MGTSTTKPAWRTTMRPNETKHYTKSNLADVQLKWYRKHVSLGVGHLKHLRKRTERLLDCLTCKPSSPIMWNLLLHLQFALVVVLVLLHPRPPPDRAGFNSVWPCFPTSDFGIHGTHSSNKSLAWTKRPSMFWTQMWCERNAGSWYTQPRWCFA